QSSGWLLPERAIRIGPYQVRLTEGLSPERAAHAASHLAVDAFDPQIDTLPQATLEFLEDTALLQVWRMNRKLALIGRLPEWRVRLRDASVSSFHACLVLTPSGLWVVDLLSRTGLTYHGEQLRFASLGSGDEVLVGKV